MKLSIIYVYYNTPKEIVNSVKSVLASKDLESSEILIIDNASPKKIPKELLQNKKIKIIHNPENVGYGAGLNTGAEKATGEVLLFVNPDTVFEQTAIARMSQRIAKGTGIGIIGPCLIGTKNISLQNISKMPFLPQSLIVFSFLRKIWPFSKVLKWYNMDDAKQDRELSVDVVSGACMMMKSKVFIRCKKFDPRFFMYFEEADICYRIRKLGLKILYFPSAKVTHLVGKSSTDKKKIQGIFEKSRFLFNTKYHGIFFASLAEIFFRIATLNSLLLIIILTISSWVNLYKLQDYMMFFGDFAHDFLSASNMLITHKIPLVGITSSVTWLHQGPLSIYLIGLAFAISNFNPVAPAIFYALIGVISCYFVYLMGKVWFSRDVGLLAALFYATSPLVVVNARIPYHTAPIPFFSCIFFLLFYQIVQKQRSRYIYFLTFLSLGLLLLLELSNATLFIVVAIVFIVFRRNISRSNLFGSLAGFSLGILPFILYDFTNHFKQTIGFPLWILNRIRLFVGLATPDKVTSGNISHAIVTVSDQINRAIFPSFPLVTFIICIMLISLLWLRRDRIFQKKREKGLILSFLWLLVPLIGFLIHTAPGTAYFPLIFPPLALLIGYTAVAFFHKFKIGYVVFVVLMVYNTYYIVSNQYFLDTSSYHGSKAKGWNYGFGPALSEQEKIARFLIADAKGKGFILSEGGSLAKFSSSIDNYKYLVWWMDREYSENAHIRYTIFAPDEEHVKSKYFSNEFIIIQKSK